MKTVRQILGKALLFAGAAALLVAPATQADQVILDDLIVDGSICVGQDCVNGESFGFDTLRLKENNLRVKFQDTSSTSSFPQRDWQITANDSANGGLEQVLDRRHRRRPHAVHHRGGRAQPLASTCDDGGRVGLGTSTPVVELHVKSTATPRPCAWSRTARAASPRRPGTWPATSPASSSVTPPTARRCRSASFRARRRNRWSHRGQRRDRHRRRDQRRPRSSTSKTQEARIRTTSS